jgi:hypothetical protein
MALQATPFEVVCGFAPPPLFPYLPGATRVVVVERQLRDRDEFMFVIKELVQSQQVMKRAHDKQHHDVEYVVGDWVWLRLSHQPTTSVRQAGAARLSAKYFRPYQILDKIGPVSYRLQLSTHAKIHNVFHVVFLKKFEGTPLAATPPLPSIVHGHVVMVLDPVVRVRLTATSWELLVQW